MERIAFQQIRKFREILIDLQKIRLDKGESTTGRVFGTYSLRTQEIAQGESTRQPKVFGEPYNFEWTGGFFDGMQLVFKGNTAEFISRDSKTPFLQTKYPGLLGLDDDSWTEFVNKHLYPAFMAEIRRMTGL